MLNYSVNVSKFGKVAKIFSLKIIYKIKFKEKRFMKRFFVVLTVGALLLLTAIPVFAADTYDNSFNVTITGFINVPDALNFRNYSNRSIMTTAPAWSPEVIENVAVSSDQDYHLQFFVQGNYEKDISFMVSDGGIENFDGIDTMYVTLTHYLNKGSEKTNIMDNLALSLNGSASTPAETVDNYPSVIAGTIDSATTFDQDSTLPFNDNYYGLTLSLKNQKTTESGTITGAFNVTVTYKTN
jgi:type 1 fimbria pilin